MREEEKEGEKGEERRKTVLRLAFKVQCAIWEDAKTSKALERIKVYNVALGALRGCSEEACVSCICTENVFVVLKKRLNKLKHELNEAQIPKDEKARFLVKTDEMLKIAENLPIKAETQDCLMTRGICGLQKCIAHNISEMLNLVKP